MPITGIRIKGARELNRHLTTSIRKIPKDQRVSFRNGMKAIVKVAKMNAPVRLGLVKRELSVRIKTKRTTLGGRIQVVAMQLIAEIGTFRQAFWSLFVERGVKPHGRHPGHPGELFVSNSVDENLPAVVTALGRPLRRL